MAEKVRRRGLAIVVLLLALRLLMGCRQYPTTEAANDLTVAPTHPATLTPSDTPVAAKPTATSITTFTATSAQATLAPTPTATQAKATPTATPAPATLTPMPMATQPKATPTATLPPIPTPAYSATLVALIQMATPSIKDFAWSEDGRCVYYELWKSGGGSEWWSLQIDTGERHTIDSPYPVASDSLREMLTPKGGDVYDIILSPDGRQVLYARTEEGCQLPATPSPEAWCPHELWTASSDGSGTKRLGGVSVCYYFGFVGWFDGNRQVLVSCDYEGLGDWEIANLAESTLEELHHRVGLTYEESSGGNAALSSDGRYAFEEWRSDNGLRVVSLFGHGYLLKLQVDGTLGGPAWSKDNQWLYFLGSPDRSMRYPTATCLLRYSFETNRIEAVVGSQVMSQLDWVTGGGWKLSPEGNKAVFGTSDSLWMVSWENPPE